MSKRSRRAISDGKRLKAAVRSKGSRRIFHHRGTEIGGRQPRTASLLRALRVLLFKVRLSGMRTEGIPRVGTEAREEREGKRSLWIAGRRAAHERATEVAERLRWEETEGGSPIDWIK